MMWKHVKKTGNDIFLRFCENLCELVQFQVSMKEQNCSPKSKLIYD